MQRIEKKKLVKGMVTGGYLVMVDGRSLCYSKPQVA